MTHQTQSSNHRNLRTFVATLLAYVLLTSQLAPMAMAFNGSPNRGAPAQTSDSARKPSEAPGQGSFAAVPVPLRVTAAGMAPIITATKVDAFPDPDMDGKVSPGQNITYTVTLSNTGPDPALNLTLNDTVDPNTTLVPGSAVATPIAFADAYNVIGNVRIQPNAAQGLLANDINPNTGNNTGLTASGGTTSTQGGNVAINADGSFSYNPPVGFTGADTFTYTATSANGTDVRTVTLTVAGMIFFVNASSPAGGDGRLTNPFNCLVGAGCFNGSTADEAGDNIFLFNGAYIGGLTFLANQKLIGQGAGDTLANIAGVGAVEPYSDPLPVTNGTPGNVTITTAIAATNALTVNAGGITLRGFTVGNTTGAKILGSGFGTLTAGNTATPDLVLNGTGQALSLTTGTFAATSAFLSVATTSSGTQGISLSGVAGTVSFGSTTVSGATTQGILVGTTTANINFGNTSVTGGTDGVSLQNNSSGTRTFGTLSVSGNSGVGFLHAVGGGATTVTGATTITNPTGIGIDVDGSNANLSFAATTVNKGASSGIGVDLTNNATRTIAFTSLTVTTTNAFALNTNNSGTVNAGGGSLTQSGAGGGAASLTNTTLGLTFTSISSTNGANGIVISGGSGTLASGTTNLQNNAGIGILMSSSGVAANFGNTTVNSSAGDGVDLSSNTGAITFADLDITPDANLRGLDASNNTGTITSTSGDITTTGAPAINISGPAGRTPLSMTLTNVDSTNSPTPGVDLNLVSGNLTVNDPGVATNIANPTGIGIQVRNSASGTMNFGNTNVSGSGGTGVVLGTAGNGNTGAITFADLDITPDSGQRAFHALQNTGQLNSTTGTFTTAGGVTAVEIVGTSAASRTPLNMTLTTINVGGTPTTGIILTNTSAASGAAGFNVTGTGTDGTGGAIALSSGDAIALTDAERVRFKDFNIGDAAAGTSEFPAGGFQIGDDGIQITRVTQGAGGTYGLDLDNVKIADTQDHGINGEGGGNVGLRFINGEIINAGDDLVLTNESAMFFGSGFAANADQITGTVTITNAIFSGFTGYGFTVENAGNGTLNMTVTASTYRNNDSTGIGNSGIQIIADGSQTANNAKVNLHVLNTNFTNIDLDGVEVTTDPGATTNVTIDGGTTNSPNGDNAFHLVSGSQDGDDVESSTNLIQNVTVNAMRGSIIFLKAGAGTYHATVRDSTLDSGDPDTGAGAHLGRGVEFLMDADEAVGETINARVLVNNVTFNKIGVDGVHVGANEIVAGSQAHITVTNSTIGTAAEPVGMQDTGEGVEIIATDMTMNVSVQNNSIVSRGQTTTSEGIDIDAEGGSTVNATVVSNTISGALSPNANSFDANTEVAGTTMCLDLRTNNASGGLGANYQLAALAGSTFNFEFPGAGAITAGEIQGAQTAGTASINSGTINKNGGANCTEPLTPNTPTLPSAPETADEDKPDSGDDKGNPAPVEQITAPASSDSITSRPFISSPRQQPAVTGTTSAAQVVVRPQPAPAPASAPVAPSITAGDAPAANPPVFMGDNLTWNVGTLPAGQSVTITFQVTVDNPFMGAMPQVSNQGTVTADTIAAVLTDDPDVAGANNPTVTLVTAPPDLFVRDASVAEPASGSSPMIFTLALSTPAPTGGIVVNLSTANGTATGGTCVAGDDYESVTGGTATFAAGEQIKTFPVTVCSDANVEGDETFTLNVNSAPGANIVDAQGLGTITANVAGTTLISELRTSGPSGAGDDFVEIYNNTDTPFTVPAGGYGLFMRGATCDALPVLVGTIPAATVIPQRGHYLFVGSTYSLTAYAGGNAVLTTDIESDFNVGLFSTVDPLAISTANRLDAVGFIGSAGGICDVLREGTALPQASGSTLEHSFVREFTLVSNDVPTPTDGNDNAADFTVVTTAVGTPVGSNAAPKLGAPGPENLAGPNLKKFTQVGSQLIDPMLPASAQPNRFRDTTSDPMNNSSLGTIAIRRTFTNNTGAPITRLRFRIYDITTSPVPVGTADLRARTSTNATVTVTGVGSVTALATTLETPPPQPNSGGLNSSLAAGTVTMGTPLASGASIHINFLFGVQQSGSFRVFVFVEAVP